MTSSRAARPRGTSSTGAGRGGRRLAGDVRRRRGCDERRAKALGPPLVDDRPLRGRPPRASGRRRGRGAAPRRLAGAASLDLEDARHRGLSSRAASAACWAGRRPRCRSVRGRVAGRAAPARRSAAARAWRAATIRARRDEPRLRRPRRARPGDDVELVECRARATSSTSTPRRRRWAAVVEWLP